MKRPDYCIQPTVPNCWECSLCNYGRDCMNRSISARELGSKTSEAKAAAARANGAKGGRPRKKPVAN